LLDMYPVCKSLNMNGRYRIKKVTTQSASMYRM
jgi:hypothetical protein